MSANASALAQRSASWGEWSWLSGRTWDVRFILASVALVPLPLLLFHGLGFSVVAVNLVVAALVGGPHMYSTYTLTFLEKKFWLQYPLYTLGAFLVPVGVVLLAITDLTILLTVFLAWASFHVLQQAAFIADSYRARGQAEPSRWGQVIDYGVIFSSLYPFAMWKLVNDQFIIENHILQLPWFLKSDAPVYLAWFGFLAMLSLWIGKSVLEAREGRLNYTKTIFIGLTVAAAFVIPMFNQLDVAFQGLNTWHSFQYLAIIWLVNKQRKERNAISSGLVRGLAGADNTWRFYATLVGITVLGGVLIVTLQTFTSLSTEQCYYIVVLGGLLVHYYFDTFFFTSAGRVMQSRLTRRTSVWDWP